MSGRRRSAFEQFWSAKLNTNINDSSSSDLDKVRQRKREIRAEKDLNPGGFVSGDAPIGAKMLFKQKEEIADLAALATAEGSAIEKGSWVDFVSPKDNFEANKENLFAVGAKLPEDERVKEQRRQAEAAKEQARKTVRDFLMSVCEDVKEAGGNGPEALRAAAEDRVPDQPGIDGEEVRNSVQDILDEFGSDTLENAIRECEIEMEQEVTRAPTPTDRKGRLLRPTGEVVEQFVSAINTEGIEAAMNEVTDVELGQVADEVESGELDAGLRDRLSNALESVPDDPLGAAADESDELFSLLYGLGLRVPPPPQPDPEDLLDEDDDEPVIEELSDDALEAIDRVRGLLGPAAARDAEFYAKLITALETGDPVSGVGLGRETLDLIPPERRELLAEEARERRMEELDAEDVGFVDDRDTGDDQDREPTGTGGADRPDRDDVVGETGSGRDIVSGGPPGTDPSDVPRGGAAGEADGRLDFLSRRFPQPTIRQEYQRLENIRVTEGGNFPTLPPGQFYDEFADEILGETTPLSRQEFVEGKEDPSSTAFF